MSYRQGKSDKIDELPVSKGGSTVGGSSEDRRLWLEAVVLEPELMEGLGCLLMTGSLGADLVG